MTAVDSSDSNESSDSSDSSDQNTLFSSHKTPFLQKKLFSTKKTISYQKKNHQKVLFHKRKNFTKKPKCDKPKIILKKKITKLNNSKCGKTQKLKI